ncbi:MAG: hypothetical protein IT556_13240, partial [Acetobacteraceae bacterium]|nr:hypothetical protein [Acetobacteraceae bacterium]
MWRSPWLCVALLLAVAIAGCGEVPRPFAERREAGGQELLRRPPPARILVPAPTEAGLTQDAAQRFAEALAEALREQELPATASPSARRGPRDWQVAARFEPSAMAVALSYALIDEKGERVGTVRAPRPVPIAAWANADPAALSAAAADAGPAIAALTGRADTARRAAGPTAPARLPTVAVL